MKRSTVRGMAMISGLLLVFVIAAYSNHRHLAINLKVSPQLSPDNSSRIQEAGIVDQSPPKRGPLQQDLGNAQPEEFIEEETRSNFPQYQFLSLTVHSHRIVSATLRNSSSVELLHNWVLVKPGSENHVQSIAVAAGAGRQWIPESPEILAFIPLTQPGQSSTSLFRAPEEPGDFPFLCTFPGHGSFEKGVLHVLP